ncbi:MAG: ABC transporter substrate-binding protein [Betaproteobacteria bacterium]|nr:ABC transporter substrate-binding protein [Betaproteobacteria bacterium]
MHTRSRFRIRAALSAERILSLISATLIGIATLAGPGLAGTQAQAATTVRVGITNSSSDVGFFIAEKKGYFLQEGINVTYTPFDSAAKMVAPLGVGQLDVGGGSSSAGLFNAAARGIPIKIVADKGSSPPGHGYVPLLVRKDLVISGRVKSFHDLKGLKVAGSSPGISTAVMMNEALKKGGLTYSDVTMVSMGFPQHVLALQNKAIDASLTTEPSATAAVINGAAVRFAGNDEIYPYHQVAVVLYGGIFIKDNPEVARKFMRAYVRAVRDYNDALKDGKLTGPKADEIIAILVEFTNIKDPNVYRTIVTPGNNPDGKVNEASLRKDFQFYKEQGLIEGDVSVEQVVDNSFAEAAVKELGAYVRRGK